MRKHSTSEKIFHEATALMPGGVNSPARAFGAVGGTPIVIDHAYGPWLYDVDGNKYVDYVLSWGPMILGHQQRQVKEALIEAVGHGTSYGTPTRAENELASLLIEMIPSVEKVRLVNSGTEATMSALRLARGFTQRELVVKFIGNYHGHVDSLLVAAGSAAATLSVPNSPGVTAGTARDTILLPYNDSEAVANLFESMGDKIAAVILEPVAGNMGCVPAEMSFLRQLRESTAKSGALLIFDEVMCGFRVGHGSAQQLYGIMPDLTTLGKIIGGGLPVGAYGGRADIMDHVLPAGKVFQAGTLSGNPLACAAGIATLGFIRDIGTVFYDRLEAKTQRLATGLQAKGEKWNLAVRTQALGSMMTLFFTESMVQSVRSWDDAARCRTDLFARFFHGMLDRGFYLPCSQFEALFLSIDHTDEIIDETIVAADETFGEIAAYVHNN